MSVPSPGLARKAFRIEDNGRRIYEAPGRAAGSPLRDARSELCLQPEPQGGFRWPTASVPSSPCPRPSQTAGRASTVQDARAQGPGPVWPTRRCCLPACLGGRLAFCVCRAVQTGAPDTSAPPIPPQHGQDARPAAPPRPLHCTLPRRIRKVASGQVANALHFLSRVVPSSAQRRSKLELFPLSQSMTSWYR